MCDKNSEYTDLIILICRFMTVAHYVTQFFCNLTKCFYHHTEIEQLLLAQDRESSTFLHTIAEYSTAEEMTVLLSEIPDEMEAKLLTLRDTRGRTVLHRAADNNKDERVILSLLATVKRSCETQGTYYIHYLLL